MSVARDLATSWKNFVDVSLHLANTAGNKAVIIQMTACSPFLYFLFLFSPVFCGRTKPDYYSFYQSRGFLWSRLVEMDRIGIVRPGSDLFAKKRRQRQSQANPSRSTAAQMAFLPLTFSLT
jgi:hypothetical protein